jgi:methylated-DNA-[protein]-cysteine S-methyltransferase
MSMIDYQASIKTPFAHLGIRLEDNRLAAIDFIRRQQELVPTGQAGNDICMRIRHYLDNPLHNGCIDIPCSYAGTPFQVKVWKALREIPPGRVVTYGELAGMLGTSARAVGNACRRNPIPVVIPCHRVVAASGIGGYAGATDGSLLAVKNWLLQHEGVAVARLC